MRKSYENYYNNRGDYQNQQHDGGNRIEQRMQNIRLDSGSHSSGGKPAVEHKEQGPKKMTWATIASQPAKPQISTTSTTIKKKGLGPPPPMIPGKHNMELTDGWDTPKTVVPPSPPVIQAPQPELIEKQNNSNYEGQPAWPTPGQAQNQAPSSATGNNNNNSYPAQQQPPHQQQQHQNNQRGGYSMNNHQNNYQGNGSGRREYNQNSSSGGDRQHQSNYNSSHHYNDFQKPYHQHPHQMPTAPPQNHQPSAPITRSIQPPPPVAQSFTVAAAASSDQSEDSILEQLRVKNQYNPSELDLSQVDNAR